MSPEGTIGDAFGGKYMLGHNEQIVGTCSCCGGPVVTPICYWSVVPPTPACRKCGAQATDYFGPVIQTRPNPVKSWPSTGTGTPDWTLFKYDTNTSAVPNGALVTYLINGKRVDLDKSLMTGQWEYIEQQPGHS